MTTPMTQAMPSQQELQNLVGSAFSISDSQGRSVPATLLSVHSGVAIDEWHVSYSAVFGLPLGITAPQGSYQIAPQPASGDAPPHPGWMLFVAPLRPGRDGQPQLEAVFHIQRDSADSALPAMACAG